MDPRSGGPCEGIRNVIPELESWGITHEVVCTDWLNAGYSNNDPFKTYAIGSKNPNCYFKKNLIPWLREHIPNYSLIVVHTLWGYHTYAVRKVVEQLKNEGKANHTKYYIMAHGMLDPYFQIAKHRRLKAIRNIIYWELVERKVINQAEGVLFTCEAERQLARLPFRKYNPKKEINVGYGIYPPPAKSDHCSEVFLGKIKKTNNSVNYILFLSRINIKKGVDLLVEAYAKILASSDIHTIPDLVIAGPGIDSEFGAKILNRVKSDDKLNRKIHFPGMLTGDAKWGAFYGCEAFILPSHQENFGVAVVEALACKKVVLITNKINIHKEIENDKAGMVESDDEIGIYSLLDKWLKLDDKEKNKMSENTFDCFQKHFTIKNAALQLKKLYEESLVA